MEAKPRRISFQFNLKSLLVVTLLVASFLGGRASMMSRVEDAEYWANNCKTAQRKAESDLRSVFNEMNDFKRRHGIPLQIYLEDLDLNEWGTWQPKSGREP